MSTTNKSRLAMTSLEISGADPWTLRQQAIFDLLRAVSIGRVIAYVGSGTSLVYGYLSWDELCEAFAQDVIDTEGSTLHENSAALDSQYSTIKAAIANKKFPRHDLLDLGQAVLHLLDKSEVESIQKKYADRFSSPERCSVGIFKSRVNQFTLANDHQRILLQSLGSIDDALLPPDLRAACALFDIKMSNHHSALVRLNTARPEIDPLRSLEKDLQISRFATLNYDLEIEKLFEDGDFPYDTIANPKQGEADASIRNEARSRSGVCALSITMRPNAAADLLKFALQTRPETMHVIHVHGSIRDANSMVLTSDQYNALYVNEHETRASFDDAQQLIVSANAVLFVGIGLKEEDFVRPLRRISSKVQNRPLFALMASDNSLAHDFALIHRMKSRYGIQVILYGTELDDELELGFTGWAGHPLLERLEAMKLGEINPKDLPSLHVELETLESTRKGFSENPALLRELGNPQKFPRLASSLQFGPLLRSLNWAKLSPKKIEPFIKHLDSIARTQALDDALKFLSRAAPHWRQRWQLRPLQHSPKSIKLLHVPEETIPLEEIVACNWISESAEKMQNHFDMKKKSVILLAAGKGKGTWLRIASHLANRAQSSNRKTAIAVMNFDYTLQIDALFEDLQVFFERQASGTTEKWLYLHQVDQLLNLQKSAFSSARIEVFFEALRNWSDLGVLASCQEARTAKLLRSYLTDETNFGAPELVESKKILSALNPPGIWAHIVGLSLAKAIEGEAQQAQFRRLLPKIWQQSEYFFAPDQRISGFIGRVLGMHSEMVEQSGSADARITKVLMHSILKWIAAFALPVPRSTFSKIPEIQEIGKAYAFSETLESRIDAALQQLVSTKLCSKLDENNRTRYTIHREMRRYLVKQSGMSYMEVDGREWVAPSLYPVLMDHEPMLTKEDYIEATQLFEALVESDDRDIVRSAFGLFRGSLFLCGVLRAGQAYDVRDPNNSVLDCHMRRLLRLHAAARSDSTAGSAFYNADRLWLLNELGVVRLLQGNFHDAEMILSDAARFAIETNAWACSRARIDLNLASAVVERGRLDEAMTLTRRASNELDQVAQMKRDLLCVGLSEKPETKAKLKVHDEIVLLKALAKCVQAQVYLLTGERQKARRAIDLVEQSSRNLGSVSFLGWVSYLKHQTKFYSENVRFEIDEALALARGARRIDLQMSFELAEIEFSILFSRAGDYHALSGSLRTLDRIMLDAKHLGFIRISVAANLVRTRLQLALGQIAAARDYALAAIDSAMHYGMRMKRISAIMMLCAVMIARGERDAALSLLGELLLTAERFRYVRAAVDIGKLKHAATPEDVMSWASGQSQSAGNSSVIR